MTEKILIIDDDPDTIKFLSSFFKKLGYEPLAALEGVQGLKMAHEKHPDLIVLDVMMPGVDGYEVARSLRRHPETALIPILMFTAKAQVEDKLAGYETGVDIYLTKPIHPVELQANVKALLAKRKARTDTLSQTGYVVGVIAAKGGLGVSTVALNLAIAYKQARKAKVIAVELRPGQGTWAEELGFVNSDGLVNLLRMSRPEITPAAIEKQLSPSSFGVPLLLASNEVCGIDCMAAVNQFEAIVDELGNLAEMIVLDIGTNFHPAFEPLLEQCNEIILVTEPQPVAVKRTRYLVTELKARDYGSAKVLTLVTVNRLRIDLTLSVSQIESMLGYSVTLGFPPMPELAHLSATRNSPMYLTQGQGGTITKQFDVLADIVSQHLAAVKA